MAIDAHILEAMLASGASAEVIVAAVKADQQKTEADCQARRAKDAERKRKSRANLSGEVTPSHTKSQGLDATPVDSVGLKDAGVPYDINSTPTKTSLRSDIVPARKELFAELWSALPRRDGSNPKQPAEEKFYRLLKASKDEVALAQEIISGARRYAASMVGRAPKFVMQTTRFLNQGVWKDEHHPPPPNNGARYGSTSSRPKSITDFAIQQVRDGYGQRNHDNQSIPDADFHDPERQAQGSFQPRLAFAR